MVSTSDFRNGLSIIVDGEIYTVIWFQHHKPGKGGAKMRTKLRNIRTGNVLEKTFQAGERFSEPDLVRKKKQYLYRDGERYIFMDMETYEQMPFTGQQIGGGVRFLCENMEVEALYHEDKLLGVELPLTVVLEVTYTEPGRKSDTVTGATKNAVLSTGLDVQVPLFIDIGDKIKVNTQTGEYAGRV